MGDYHCVCAGARYSLAFEELKAKSDNDAKKLGSMYFKLLVLVGLAVMLILA